MKKFLLSFIILAFCGIAKAQDPIVNINIDEVTSTTVTVTFQPNDQCTSYSILAAETGSLDPWITMMGMDLIQLIDEWGISTNHDTTYTWTEMVPGVQHTIYVAVHGAETLYVAEQNVTTLTTGGSGESIISLEVRNITATTARLICTPNEETAVFYDGLIEKSFAETIGMDSAIAIIKESPYPQYETDNWVWSDLTPSTTYLAIAIGQNAEETWGEAATLEFTTNSIGNQGINGIDSHALTIYPNPASEWINITNIPSNSKVFIYSIDGKIQFQNSNASSNEKIDISNWEKGAYVVRIQSGSRVSSRNFIIQ